MTEDKMDLQGLLGKSADADFLREMIGFAAERLMELEVGALTSSGRAPPANDRQAGERRHGRQRQDR